jgi:hypothetical protein
VTDVRFYRVSSLLIAPSIIRHFVLLKHHAIGQPVSSLVQGSPFVIKDFVRPGHNFGINPPVDGSATIPDFQVSGFRGAQSNQT